VTILFCDLARRRSVTHGDAPAARLVLERHGGTVEKFVGDAVLRTLGDLAGAQRLLESLVERETAYGRHRAADRYRRD